MGKSPVVSWILALAGAVSIAPGVELPGVWGNWRGPHQNGTSRAAGLPESWSPAGENLVWKVPIGGRSAPVLMGNRLYMLNSAGEGDTLQEQVLCLDADSGRTVWSYRFNVYGSDVPPHRAAWASPVVDPQTGRVYAMGVGGRFLCLDSAGKLVWDRSLAEEFGLITTHGGRTVTPIVHGDLVITSGIMSSWGAHARSGHRYLAMDKATGEVIWFSKPGANPYDTCYPTPIVTGAAGRRLLVDGGCDGAINAMKLLTGEPVWHFPFSKRAINASVVTDGKLIFASHGQENYDTNVMGRVVALRPDLAGSLDKSAEAWRTDGLIVEFPSAALHGGRLYMADNGANLICLDSSSGKELWRKSLGTIQRASPVHADGKIYIGTENGKFYILRPGDTGCEVLDADQLSAIAGEEEIHATVAVAPGRIYLVSSKNTYCIGTSKRSEPVGNGNADGNGEAAPSPGPPAYVQVTPAELVLRPGERVVFRARSYDGNGVLVREEKNASWSLAGIKGEIAKDGTFSTTLAPQAGEVKAAAGAITGAARVRVLPALPWTEDFESYAAGSVPPHWVGAGGKFEVREIEGNKVLVKLANEFSLLRRARAYMGEWRLSDYTVEADVLGTEKRRQMPDVAVIGQTYALVLAGNAQKLVIESWTPETRRSVTAPFSWKPGVWYRMKLRTDNLEGKALVRGKVWPRSEPEPAEWTISKEDGIPSLQGAPGLYCYAHNEAYYDNIKVTENSQ